MSDYAGILPRIHPTQAVDVLNDRVRQVGKLNTVIADWLNERSKLEEMYAAGLRKLARKNLDDADLGIFSVPWSTLTNSMDTLADSHSSLASKITVDIETPLRDFVTSGREMQAMSTIQGNLASMARDVERAQQKTEKLQIKGERAEAGRVANASSDLDNARSQWESQAPYIFENLQQLDESRVNQLRDLLTQFQTLETDQVEKSRVAAERCLNILLNVETQDEIKTFALKAAASQRNARSGSRASVIPPSIPTRGASSSNPNALSTIPSNAEEDASTISASTPEPSKKSSSIGKGLKRIGTVMSRRNSKQPSQLSDTPEAKSKSSPFGRIGRAKGSYSLEPPQEEDQPSSRRPRSPLRMGSEVLEPPHSRDAPSSSSGAPRLEPIPRINGTSSSGRSPATANFSNGGHQGDLADLEPPQPTQSEAPRLAEQPRDNEGFSVPAPAFDPISQAQADAAALNERTEPPINVNIRNSPIREEGGDAALASVATKLQAPPPTTRRAGTVRGRRDARNSTVISTYGPPEHFGSETISVVSPATAERSIEPIPIPSNIPSTEHVPPMAAPVQTPPEPSSSLVQSPSGAFGSFSPPSEITSPFRPSSRAALASDHTGDGQSIRSGRSTASQSTRHPELQEAGLCSSIIETVSARFENGELTTSSLVGEIALAYNPLDFNAPFGHESIRLENFSSLEKVAPNPSFITQNFEKEGEYSVNLSNISKTQIAFKYQLRHEDASSQAPLLVTPACKIEPTQTSVIVSYALHPSFALTGRQNVTLSNVLIALTLDGAKAGSCLTKPQGTFNREKSTVYWQLGDITLSPGGAPEKLLARFATDSEANGASVEARWEISSDATSGIGSPLAVSMQGLSIGEGADPFADEGAAAAAAHWKPVPAVRKLASGHYVAKS